KAGEAAGAQGAARRSDRRALRGGPRRQAANARRRLGHGHDGSLPRHPRVVPHAKGSAITRPDRLAHLTKEAWRAFVRELQGRLAEHGVSFGHWTFLRILWQRDGLTQRELSDEAGVMEPSTHAAIKAMEKLGYVKRKRLPDNRKNLYVRLTP